MSESLNGQLAELHAERVRTWAPEALKVNVEQRQTLVEQARHEQFVRAGDVLAPFELLGVDGDVLDSTGLLANGPLVLVFFRFAGCPACNIALPYYQRQLQPALQARGATLVAVSPQVPERLVEIRQRHALTLQVASDPDNRLARRLGILYSFDDASRKASLASGRTIGEVTGTGTWELPQPTVVVLGSDGRVQFAEVSPDWLVRTEAQPIIDAVDALLAHPAQAARRA